MTCQSCHHYQKGCVRLLGQTNLFLQSLFALSLAVAEAGCIIMTAHFLSCRATVLPLSCRATAGSRDICLKISHLASLVRNDSALLVMSSDQRESRHLHSVNKKANLTVLSSWLIKTNSFSSDWCLFQYPHSHHQ